MRIRLVKWLCIAALFVAFVFWQKTADYESPLKLVIASGAAVVAVQAFRVSRYRWMLWFLGIVLLFNPTFSVLTLANRAGLAAIILAAASFAVSLTMLKSQPLLSMASITGRTPGSESL